MKLRTSVLYIDCQILQTPAFDRGMGKYTTSLLSALRENNEFKNTYNTVKLFCNQNLQIDVERIGAIQSIFPQSELILADLPIDADTETEEKYQHAQRTLSTITSLDIKDGKEVHFLITSPFFVKFPAVFPQHESVKKFCVVYDLIPYKIWFKQRIFPDELYFRHFSILLEADVLFTISQAVADDLHNLLWIDRKKLQNIDGGPFEQPESVTNNERPTENPYIIYPSAPIVHKNNKNAVEGFELFNKQVGSKYKLVFTSTFDEDTINKLKELSNNLLFTGNVSDEMLAAYRRNAEVVLFASLAEGLGMPILEGVIDDKPVACSAIPVHLEISAEALYFFDPTRPKSISEALLQAVNRQEWDEKQSYYQSIKDKYVWANSATAIMEGINNSTHLKKEKKRILILSPGGKTGRADARMAELLFSSLGDYFDVYWQESRKYRQTEVPSYLDIINKRPTGKINDIIVIGSAKSIPAGKNILRIKLGPQRWWQLFTGRENDTIEIQAQRKVIDEGLQFREWEFTSKQIIEMPTGLIKVIKEKFS